MLAAAQRLRRREDFAATIRNGRRAGRGALVVHYMQSADETTEPAPRAGFVVSKAVGNAVVRNTVKRRLRHLVRSRLADLPPGAVVVVRALPDAATRQYDILEKDLDSALEAARRPKTRGARR
ncbi:ribonuclease P protein component [Dactylosporangium roseum]|uniref:Ribonuclease P protein component n=2 Tax=Dactylosporangium TaxID=35753 RepID=A0ABY5VZR7_9ACTN|nr:MULTISPECIES: ribonuclease P protein component [Dactylosporangium]UWP82752.1 ribonuclease P protein component [Dactylosporangium fulvum]UWZ36782.1 ribonuclease P protein component [Dactylosporangium roseum]